MSKIVCLACQLTVAPKLNLGITMRLVLTKDCELFGSVQVRT